MISHFYLNLRESASPTAGASASTSSQTSGTLQFGPIVGDLGINSMDFDQPAAEDENGVEVVDIGDADFESDHIVSGSAQEIEPSAQGDRDDA